MSNVLEENRSKGWIKLPDNAPQWVRVFVTEYRSANLADRKMNDRYLDSFNSGCEKRSLALGRAVPKVLAPIIPHRGSSGSMSITEARKWASEGGLSFESVLAARNIERTNGVPMIDSLNHMKLVENARRIEASKLTPTQVLEESGAFRDLTADGTYHLKTALDVACRKRPSDEQIARRPYGFTDLIDKVKK